MMCHILLLSSLLLVLKVPSFVFIPNFPIICSFDSVWNHFLHFDCHQISVPYSAAGYSHFTTFIYFRQRNLRRMTESGGAQKNTAYGVFVQACWAQHKRQYPDELIHKEIEEFNKQCSVWWYNLSEQERDRFQVSLTDLQTLVQKLTPDCL